MIRKNGANQFEYRINFRDIFMQPPSMMFAKMYSKNRDKTVFSTWDLNYFIMKSMINKSSLGFVHWYSLRELFVAGLVSVEL